jgi:integrase
MRRKGSGTTRKLPSGRYQARIVRPDGKRESLGTYRTKTEAERALVRAEAEQIEGAWEPTPDNPGTVAEWGEKWLAEAHHLKPKTVAGHIQMLHKHVLPRWGNAPITSVTKAGIREWVGDLITGGCKPDVIRCSVDALRLSCKAALEAGIISTDPVIGISLPRRPKREMHPLTVEQIEALAEAISHPELKPGGNGARVGRSERPDLGLAVRLAAYTGLRAGELWAIRRKHVDLDHRIIRVMESVTEVGGELIFGSTKTGANRAVTWPASLDEAIANHLATRPDDPDALVFVSTTDTPMRHSGFMKRSFKPALERAGLPQGTRFHDLRHTHASLLIAMGAHPKAIQERLGHSSITITLNIYGHLFPGLGDELAQGLDTLIQNQRGHDEGI